uniref:Small subunit processome component 20 homolog n=2 Tax=Cacopsylla melanoneura TaxID=428564 RepID=A0A8D8VZB4_9HEMI
MCFNWLAALAVKLSADELQSIALSALAPLVREMGTTEEKYADIRQAASEAANYYKKRLGSEVYLKLVATLQQRQDVRKAARKKERAQELIKNPQTAAKRKITKQLKRKEQKKKKMEIIKMKNKHKVK